MLNFYLFADDTNIYYEAESLNKLETIINKELKKLHTWLIVNRLSLNIDKTNFLVFHPYNKPCQTKNYNKNPQKCHNRERSHKVSGSND